jgi:hypothetical protein
MDSKNMQILLLDRHRKTQMMMMRTRKMGVLGSMYPPRLLVSAGAHPLRNLKQRR